MKNDLVINPFIQIQFTNEEKGDYFLIAPKPQSGLLKLEITKAEHPNLHELFLDLAQTRFDFLDVEIDIDEAERELLLQSGVLVNSDNVPQNSLFACLLDEVEIADFEADFSALIVDPTFRFEPFNFANFISWVHEKHLSPHKASVWLRQPVTGIEIGYWLDNSQAETVAKFTVGEKPAFEIEPELLAKLLAAGILTTPAILAESVEKESAALAEARSKYLQDKYVVLHRLLPPAQMRAMRRFYRQYVAQGFMPFGDDQVNRRYYQHNEPLAGFLHKTFAAVMSLVIGEEVIPSYVYAASYLENAVLDPHTDRPQCEFSMSLQIDYLPEPENQRSPWGLFVWQPDFANGEPLSYFSQEFPAESQEEDKNPAVYLASGDGLIYKGCELIHYRYALPEGHQSTSLFFHYVPKDFEGVLH